MLFNKKEIEELNKKITNLEEKITNLELNIKALNKQEVKPVNIIKSYPRFHEEEIKKWRKKGLSPQKIKDKLLEKGFDVSLSSLYPVSLTKNTFTILDDQKRFIEHQLKTNSITEIHKKYYSDKISYSCFAKYCRVNGLKRKTILAGQKSFIEQQLKTNNIAEIHKKYYSDKISYSCFTKYCRVNGLKRKTILAI